MPPRDSPYFNPDIFHDLENDIVKFSTKGFIMLTGDFNARTGCVLDFVDLDQNIHIPDDNLFPKHNLRKRKNYDPQLNEHGQSLHLLLLRIANGRTTEDSFGNITYHSPQKESAP